MFEMWPTGPPSPRRITVGVLLMMLVSMWTFVAAPTQATESTTTQITETVQSPDVICDSEDDTTEINHRSDDSVDGQTVNITKQLPERSSEPAYWQAAAIRP